MCHHEQDFDNLIYVLLHEAIKGDLSRRTAETCRKILLAGPPLLLVWRSHLLLLTITACRVTRVISIWRVLSCRIYYHLVLARGVRVSFTLHVLLDLCHASVFVEWACMTWRVMLLIKDHEADQTLRVRQRTVHELVKLLYSGHCWTWWNKLVALEVHFSLIHGHR